MEIDYVSYFVVMGGGYLCNHYTSLKHVVPYST